MTPVHPAPHPQRVSWAFSTCSSASTNHRFPSPTDSSSIDIVRLTDGVYDLLYHTSYAERCHRDGQNAGSAWLHGQMDL